MQRFVFSHGTVDVAPLSLRVDAADDQWADLEVLYREHHGFVWRSLRHLGLPEDGVHDALQEVFLIAHRKLSQFRGDCSVRSWLYGIARRVAADLRRKRTRREARLVLLTASEAPAPDGSMAERWAATDLVERILGMLGPDKREVFILAEIEGMTGPEISAALGINLNTAYARLRAARELFQREVDRLEAQERGVSGWHR